MVISHWLSRGGGGGVTLIISVATPKVIVQASDRRLTRKDNGNIIVMEDEENKALFVTCEDARMCISFTGVAYVQGVPTTQVIADLLTRANVYDMSIEEVMEELDRPIMRAL